MRTFDPSHEYAYVDGIMIDAKHPNGDIDRIKTTGDHAVGEGFLIRGEPLVYVMNAISSLTKLNVIQTYYNWYLNALLRHDSTIRRSQSFSRSITASQINSTLNSLRTNVISYLCKSEDAQIAKGTYLGNYLTDNPSFRVDASTFRTSEFDSVNRLTPVRKDIIEALVADAEYIMDGSCILVTGLEKPTVMGWSAKPYEDFPSDCTMTSSGDVYPSEEYVGRTYYTPRMTAYKTTDSDGKEVLVNYKITPDLVNRFSVRLYNASKTLFDDGATRKHVSITALFKFTFNGLYHMWFPVKLTENPPGMASISGDVFQGIFDAYANLFGAELPSRDHLGTIGCGITDVNIIVKLSKTRDQE